MQAPSFYDNDGGCDNVNDQVLALQQKIIEYEGEIRSLRAYVEGKRELLNMLQAMALDSSGQRDGRQRDGDKPGDGRGTSNSTDSLHPLSVAAVNGDIDMVKVLLDGGMDVGSNNNEALLQACQHGRTDVAAELLRRGADVHVDHGSPLLWAVRRGDIDMVRLLLEHHADPTRMNKCALRLAVDLGNTDVVQLLLLRQAT